MARKRRNEKCPGGALAQERVRSSPGRQWCPPGSFGSRWKGCLDRGMAGPDEVGCPETWVHTLTVCSEDACSVHIYTVHSLNATHCLFHKQCARGKAATATEASDPDGRVGGVTCGILCGWRCLGRFLPISFLDEEKSCSHSLC